MTGIRRKNHIFHLSYEQRNAVRGYWFILPWLIGFMVFYAGCLVQLGEFSLSRIGLDAAAGMTKEYIGVGNYLEAFTSHATFKQTLASSVMDMLIDLPMIIFFSLFVAMLLNRRFRGRALVRAIFFLPIILSADAVGSAITRATELVNAGVSSANLEAAQAGTVSVSYYMDLFGDLAIPDSILGYIVDAVNRISSIIKGSGVQIILFIAALQSIPGSLYEVARIEGATGYESFWKVTFPMVMPHIITNTIYTVVDRFSSSEAVRLATRTYKELYNYGLSSAFSVVSTLITILILGLIVYLLNKRTFYYN
ncbi:MAG: sugar ABC transporter permease [Clostridia bacterium]|nr:sugar ABC transporter permease [Clostridia bacterium]